MCKCLSSDIIHASISFIMSIKKIVTVFFAFAVLLASWPAQAVTVKAMRAGIHPDKTRLVFDLSGSVPYRAFIAESPSRSLVVELPQGAVKASLDMNFKKAGLTSFKKVPQGNGKMRLVFALSKPLKLTNSFILASKKNTPPRLVVDLLGADKGTSYHSAYNTSQASSGILGQLVIKAPAENQELAVKPRQVKRDPVNQRAEAYEKPAPVLQKNESLKTVDVPASVVRSKGAKKIIILDPGHGGKDTGAIGKKNLEKNITLAMARQLKKQLEETGRYKVKLTRNSDVFITLPGRVKFARENRANLFISLHADSIDHSNDRRELINGASIYTLSEKASDAQTAKLAERENKVDLLAGVNLGVESKEVADILLDLAMRETMNQSKYFANTIVQRFETGGVRLLEKPHRFAGFAVLKAPDVPSVLIELGFMSNRHEESLLSTDAHRRKIASAITSGVDSYFDKLEQAQQN